MKKCPYCAEEVQDAALVCKHCKSSLVPTSTPSVVQPKTGLKTSVSTTKLLKYSGFVVLAIAGIYVWYLSIPTAAIWYLWKYKKLQPKQRIALTCVLVLVGITATALVTKPPKAPEITIVEPVIGVELQVKTATIKGTVKPTSSKVSIAGTSVAVSSDGTFNYQANLTEESNSFVVTADNKGKANTQTITIKRLFTPEELAERERLKAEAEAKRKVDLAAQQRAQTEAEAKAKAEQAAFDASKAGKLCKTQPTWTKSECDALADNKYWVGMSFDMLKAQRGLPNSANPSNYGYGTDWQWCWHDWTPSCFYDDNEDGIIDSYN